MKHLWIGLIVAGSLAACRNGSNNARDTTGIGSGGTAGGSIPATSDTTGLSGGSTMPSPAMGTSPTGSAAGDTTAALPRDTTKPDSARRYKNSRKHK